MKPLGKAHVRIDIKYYMYALLFIIFDVEFVFLLPWAMYLADFRGSILELPAQEQAVLWLLLLEAALFVGMLVLGLAYAWRRRAFDWQ
jgi:NADH-quinone oxidoreductase subunit A